MLAGKQIFVLITKNKAKNKKKETKTKERKKYIYKKNGIRRLKHNYA